MKAILFVTFAMVFYGMEHVLIERYFPKVPTMTVLFYMNMPVFVILCLVYLGGGLVGIHMERPSKEVEVWMIITSVVFIVADIFLYKSYSNGMSATTATTAVLMVPVFASIFKNVMHWGHAPNRYTILAWIFGAITLIFMALSQLQEEKMPPP